MYRLKSGYEPNEFTPVEITEEYYRNLPIYKQSMYEYGAQPAYTNLMDDGNTLNNDELAPSVIDEAISYLSQDDAPAETETKEFGGFGGGDFGGGGSGGDWDNSPASNDDSSDSGSGDSSSDSDSSSSSED